MNKGDSTNWNYRSWYVAKVFNTGNEDGLFASTPSLEALRLIIRDAATRDQEEDKVIMGERCGEGVLRGTGKVDNMCRVT